MNHILYYPVEGTLVLKDRSRNLGTTEVMLNGGEYRTLTKTDGTFTFHDVEPGVYLLDVLSVEHFFSQVKINLPRSASSPIQCLEYRYPGDAKRSISYPLRLVSPGRKQYFEQREAVGLHTLLKNPMLLMVGVTGLMVLVLPKLMENMDPDEVKKMQEQMGAAQDPASMVKHLFGIGDADDDENDEKSIEAATPGHLSKKKANKQT